MKLIFLIGFTLLIDVCFAQNTFLSKTDHDTINRFFIENHIVSKESILKDTLSYHSKIEPIFRLNKKKYNGVYILVPPVEPHTEFVMLFDGSCKVLRSKDLEYDLPLILSFLSKYSKSSVKQLTVLLERLAKTYQEKNPPKGTPLKM